MLEARSVCYRLYVICSYNKQFSVTFSNIYILSMLFEVYAREPGSNVYMNQFSPSTEKWHARSTLPKYEQSFFESFEFV